MGDQSVLERAKELPGARDYGRYVAAICPFHSDRKPSLLVFPDWFRCTACGEQGRPERLFERANLRPLLTTERELHYYPEIPPAFREDPSLLVYSANRFLRQSAGYQHYLKQRGIGDSVRRYRVGYYDGWYTVPSYDSHGELKAVIFRAGPWVQEKTGDRFYQLGGQRADMYCPDWSIESPVLFVVFGIFDAISLALMGYLAVTPTTGKGSFNPQWLDYWGKRIIILPDIGEEKEANLLASKLDWRGRAFYLDYPEGVKDPNDFLQRNMRDELGRQLDELVSRVTNRNRASPVRAY